MSTEPALVGPAGPGDSLAGDPIADELADSWPVLPALLAHAHAFAASGAPAAAPRRAATVVLLRPANPFEVYAIRRAATMAFAPNMYAFPGGAVDERDTRPVAWRGPTPAEWANRLGLPEAEARAVVCAAVREVFEETGVLLAGDGLDAGAPGWEAARVDLEARRVSLAELLAAEGLAVRSDLLAPWARWLTPEFEPRRYDTYFFLARLPAGQHTRDIGGEAAHVVWLAPAEAVRLPMLLPTAYTLRQLCAYPSIDSALAAAAGRRLEMAVTPHLVEGPDGPRIAL